VCITDEQDPCHENLVNFVAFITQWKRKQRKKRKNRQNEKDNPNLNFSKSYFSAGHLAGTCLSTVFWQVRWLGLGREDPKDIWQQVILLLNHIQFGHARAKMIKMICWALGATESFVVRVAGSLWGARIPFKGQPTRISRWRNPVRNHAITYIYSLFYFFSPCLHQSAGRSDHEHWPHFCSDTGDKTQLSLQRSSANSLLWSRLSRLSRQFRLWKHDSNGRLDRLGRLARPAELIYIHKKGKVLCLDSSWLSTARLGCYSSSACTILYGIIVRPG